MSRKGFSLESQESVYTKSQLKEKITEFCQSASSTHIKVLLECIHQYDFGQLNLYFRVILYCPDDSYLDHSGGVFRDKRFKVHSCACDIYVKDEFWERLKTITQKYFSSEPRFNNSRRNFYVDYYNDNFHLKDKEEKE